MVTDGVAIAISEATKAVADAVRTRDERIMSMLVSSDPEIKALGKKRLEREDADEQALHDFFKPLRDLVGKLS